MANQAARAAVSAQKRTSATTKPPPKRHRAAPKAAMNRKRLQVAATKKTVPKTRVPKYPLKHCAKYNSKPLAVPGVIPSSIYMPSRACHTFNIPNGNTYYVVFFYSASSLRGLLFKGNGKLDLTWSIPALETSGPSAIRPNRMTVSVQSSGKADAIAGSVKVISTPEGIEIDVGGGSVENNADIPTTSVTALEELFDHHSSVRTYPTSSFMRAKNFVMPPASLAQMQSAQNFNNGLTPTIDGGQSVRATGSFLHLHHNPVFSTSVSYINSCLKYPALAPLVFQINSGNGQQTFDFTVHCGDAVRYPATSLFSHLHTAPPATNDVTFTSLASASAVAAATAYDAPSGSGFNPNAPSFHNV